MSAIKKPLKKCRQREQRKLERLIGRHGRSRAVKRQSARVLRKGAVEAKRLLNV